MPLPFVSTAIALILATFALFCCTPTVNWAVP